MLRSQMLSRSGVMRAHEQHRGPQGSLHRRRAQLATRASSGAEPAPEKRNENDSGSGEVARFSIDPARQYPRRRGRPAHLRSPDDSPLRDGNRDLITGLLTERAAKTLLIYLQELNPSVYAWLWKYMEQNPIPKKAAPWDEISGERFLRNLLYAPMTMTKYSSVKDDLFDNSVPVGVDPRQIAQRIMEIRVQLSKEFVQDLNAIADDNNTLLREALQASMASEMTTEHPAKPAPKEITPPPQPEKKLVVHPELMTSDGILYPEVAKLYPDLAKAIKKQQQEARNDARRK